MKRIFGFLEISIPIYRWVGDDTQRATSKRSGQLYLHYNFPCFFDHVFKPLNKVFSSFAKKSVFLVIFACCKWVFWAGKLFCPIFWGQMDLVSYESFCYEQWLAKTSFILLKLREVAFVGGSERPHNELNLVERVRQGLIWFLVSKTTFGFQL